jgi:hypothetical protein
MNDKDTKLLMEVYEKSIKNPSDYMQGIAKSFMSGQGDVFGHGKDESGYFPLDQGIREAIKAGKKIIVYENLS